MALTGTDRGNGTHNTAATSFTAVPASNLAAGAMAVLCVSADNAASGGTAFASWTVTDTKSNTWTKRQDALNDPGAASAGIEGAIFTSPQNGGALGTGDTITVSFGSDSPTAKTWTLMEVAASVGTPQYVTGAVGTSGTGSTSPTITSASIRQNDMIVAALFVEAGTTETITGDADSTNGSWSAQQTNKIGTTTAGTAIASQRKVVTAAGTQTYNPTLGILGDLSLAWIQVHELVNTTVTPGVLSLALTAFAPVASAPRLATPPTKALAITSFAPTVRAPRLVTPPTASLAISTFAPAVRTPRVATPATKALALSTFAPVVAAPRLTTPATKALSLTTFAPTVSAPRLVTPPTQALTLTTFAPTVTATANITVTPAPAALSLSLFAPTVSAPRIAAPGTTALTLTTFAPTVTATANVRVVPGTASLTLTTFSPEITRPGVVVPSTAALTITTFAPTVIAPATVTPGTAALTLTAFAPTVTASDHRRVVPSTAALTITTFAPDLSGALRVTPDTAVLVTTTFAPTVTTSTNVRVTPDVASLVIATFAPDAFSSTPVLSSIARASKISATIGLAASASGSIARVAKETADIE